MQKSLFEAENRQLQNSKFIENASEHTSCHWELKEDEVWLGNTGTEIPKHLKHLKTIRLGEQAYCINGNALDRNYIRPLIINKCEEPDYDKIYMKQMADASARYSK